MSFDTWWIILIGILVSWTCASLGMWLLLARKAMMGDAISHTVLLGIVGSYLLTGQRNTVIFAIGAIFVGVLTAQGTSFLKNRLFISQESSIGVSYTTLFALGILLLSTNARGIDIDQECVLYGDLLMAPLRTLVIGNSELGPMSVWLIGGMLTLNTLFLWVGWRVLTVYTFDPSFAHIQGMNVRLWNTLLMGMTALTAVVAFEEVGAILVLAFLVLPPACGLLLSRSSKGMLVIALFVGIISSFGGHFLAQLFDSAPAPGMGVCAGGIFFVSLLIFCSKFKMLKVNG